MSTQNPFAAFSENAEEADEVVKKTTGPSLTSLERIIKSSEQGKKRKVRPEEKKRLDEEKKKKNLTEIKEEETTTKKEKRIYDRKSGTGRGKEIAKDGAGGKHTWQNDTQYTKTEEENYYDTYTLSTRATLRTTMGITVEGTTAIDTTRTTTVPMGTTIRSTITVIEIITTRTSPLS